MTLEPAITTLDASAYPHLIDAVIAAASRDVLLVLRATCRSLRACADARLAETAKLHIPIGGLHVHNPGPILDVRILRDRLRRLEVTGMDKRRLPVFEGWAGSVAPAKLRRGVGDDIEVGKGIQLSEDVEDVRRRRARRKAARQRCAEALLHAQVVDITSFPHSWLRDGAPELLKALRAQTYRFHNPWCTWDVYPINTGTTVVFTPLVYGRNEWVIPVPHATFRGHRMVINLTGFTMLDSTESFSFPPTADNLTLAARDAEVVINLTGLRNSKRAKMPQGHLGLASPTARLVFKNPTANFTVVGVGQTGTPGDEPKAFRRRLSLVVSCLNGGRENSQWTPERLDALQGRIRLMTSIEYELEVGESLATETEP